MADKKARYSRLYAQLSGLLEKTGDLTARMVTVNAILYHKVPYIFWIGFYLLKDDRLIVGPYQGPLACLELERHKGVCWTGVLSRKTIIVPDVQQFEGHIACDSRSNSEIVVPLIDHKNKITGVLDADSTEKSAFDQVDGKFLEKITTLILAKL